MSLLEVLVEQFIREADEKQSEQNGMMRLVMQTHPVTFLQKCIEVLNDLVDLNNEYLRILRLIVSAASLVRAEQDGAKLAVIQATTILKKSIGKVLTAAPNEELNMLLTDLHVKLMGIQDDLVINHISDFFESGRVPESVIIKIIDSIFRSATKDYFRQFAYEILQKILSSLSLVKSDQTRLEYCELLHSIYRTLTYFEENQITINIEQVSNVSWLIFDQISKDWLTPLCQVQVLSLIGFMCQFVSKDKLERNVERLNHTYLNVLKQKNNQLRPLFEGFNKFLERLYALDKTFYENIIKSITVSLFEFYKTPIFSPNYPFDPNQLKYKNDLLQLLETLSRFNIDNCLDLFIGRINTKDQVERVACLWICHFIITRNFNKISEPYKKQLVMQLLNLSYEQDSEVRYAICEIILQFCYKMKDEEMQFSQIDMKALMFYLFQQLSIHDREIEEYGKVRAAPFETNLEILKTRAQKILTTLAQDNYFTDLLWPMSLEIIMNQKFSPGLAHIFKCLTIVLQRINIPTIYQNTHVIIVRMLLLIQIPHFFHNLGMETANFMPHLLKAFDLRLPTTTFKQLDAIKLHLAAKKNPDEYFEDRVQAVWRQCLLVLIQSKELNVIEEDFQTQMSTYLNSPALKLPIMKMQATLMSFLSNSETIKYNLDKLFSICHPEYTNQTINLNIPTNEPEFTLRQCVAECFGYIGDRHSQLVFDKMKAILNCEIIQRKSAASFKESMFQMFQKNNQEESLASVRATLLIALGYLAKQVTLDFIERNILPNVIPFLGNEQLFPSLQIALENISKAIERQLENNEDHIVQTFLLSFGRQREQILQFCQKNTNKGQVFRTLNTINIQLRLTTQPVEFIKVGSQLKLHLDSKYEIDEEQVSSTFQNIFYLYLGTIKLQEDDRILTVWESVLILLNSIKQNDQLLEVLQKSMQRLKLKIDVGYKYYFRVMLMLLSIVYKNSSAKGCAVLMLEKTLISVGAYIDIYQKSDEQFSQQVMLALTDKLTPSDLTQLLGEVHNLIIEEPLEEALGGFALLLLSLYQHSTPDLEKLLSILKLICTNAQTTQYANTINESIGRVLTAIIEQNLNKILYVMLEQQSQFPVDVFSKLLLQQIGLQKTTLIKSFSYLTDWLNNPEEIVTKNIGNFLVNVSLFIGQLLAEENQILTECIPKSTAPLLVTFILRFMTCHEMSLSGGSQASQSAIWAFEHFLNICKIDGISQSVFSKLLNEDEAEDGIQEIMMIYCKQAPVQSQKKVFTFIRGFTAKNHQAFRLGAVLVVSQFIKSNKDYENQEFYLELLETLLSLRQDNSENVRAQVAHGLGGVAYCLKKLNQDEGEQHSLPSEMIHRIMESLISSLDDAHENCIRGAMLSLQNLIDDIPNSVEYLPQLMVRVTTSFEKTFTKIRISAFSLFSKLCHICHNQSIMNEYIAIHARQALISVMLHLLDESVQVRSVCRISLDSIGDLLQQPIYKQLSNGDMQSDIDMPHLDDNEKIIMIMTLNMESDHLQSYINALVEFCMSPEYTIKGAAMFSLILLVAFRNVGDNKQLIHQMCAESKLKWATKQLVMKAAYYLKE